jgi:hypothetical protein
MPRVVDGHDRVVILSTYLEKTWPFVPFAIPSRSRENDLCDQTLSMLRAYDYDLSAVHIFVDATIVRADGTNEYDKYYTCLRQRGFGEVQLHPGGRCLKEQYQIFVEFFGNEDKIILASDTVPRIIWRTKTGNVETEELPKNHLLPLIHVGFDLCRQEGARAWSLASCKIGINLQAGHISRKCGLLCGNFCGVRLVVQPRIHMTVSDYTTDVEFSLRAWAADGCMIRFLGIAAEHIYRARGGHRLDKEWGDQRFVNTCEAIKMLAREFPTLIKYNPAKTISQRGMRYKFMQVGPAPLMLQGSFERRGRKNAKGWRCLSTKERQQRFRLTDGMLKKPAAARL